MSYILVALRKSEQERLRGQPLSTLSHTTIGQDAPERPRWLMPLLAGNLVLATVLAVWWLRSAAVSPDAPVDPGAASAAMAATAPPAAATAPIPPVQAGDTQARDAMTVPEDEGYVPLPAMDPETGAEMAPVAEPEAPVPNAAYEGAGDWQEDASAAGWPPLALSTHVYSSSPASRNVIINGMRLKEGDRLDNGVKIEEITETGARVSWRGKERQLDITR